ncbi:MAG TPA: penicillin-binding protein activator [Burkholderiales bacterium]|nr:penicillin-binding protein activator [Burkholderiales bacterium]
MQRRPAPFLFFCALLYWALVTLSTQGAHAIGFGLQEEPHQVEDLYPVPAQQQPQPSEDPYAYEDNVQLTQAHIAVLLPLQSQSFGRHADSVRLGVLSATSLALEPRLPVIVYATSDEPVSILDAYQRAVSTGARGVIGPLTRNGVSALAASGLVTVPTLALNAPDMDVRLPPELYVFGLQIEAEARQVAQLAYREGRRSAFVVSGETALGRRVAQAFVEEWEKLQGAVVDRFVYTTDVSTLAILRERLRASPADSVFLSLDASRARFIRPYLGNRLSIYATSQVFASNADSLQLYDLDAVRFLDMPWLLQPDHPAVMSYLRPDIQSPALDQERFYALGIDAYRLMRVLLRDYEFPDTLDGVTGTIRLGRGQQFERELLPAQFSYGAARLLPAAPPTAQTPR